MKLKLVLVMILFMAVSSFAFYKFQNTKTEQQTAQTSVEGVAKEVALKTKFRELTGNEYKNLFLSSSHPNTKEIVNTPEITGSLEADIIIAEIAQKRGYELQMMPKQQLNKWEGIEYQEKIHQSWQSLKTEAMKNGHDLNIESAYRSVEDQKVLFLQAINARGITVASIISRVADEDLNSVMETVAPPGYSRHHSGYVIDISDSTASIFEYSDGFKWLSANNYLKAKEHGFIPSYPEGAEKQGPEPEPWEYVWVGKNILMQ